MVVGQIVGEVEDPENWVDHMKLNIDSNIIKNEHHQANTSVKQQVLENIQNSGKYDYIP